MKTKGWKHYLLIALGALSLLSLPVIFVEKVRVSITNTLAPVWQRGANFKLALQLKGEHRHPLNEDERIFELETQKLILEQELTHSREKLLAERQRGALLQKCLLELSDHDEEKKVSHDPLLQSQLQSITGRVIYRSPSSWSNTLWVNVGVEHNLPDASPVIAKNSPVVLGNSLIGVIDLVGKKSSRVRLITDPNLTPSVRTLREKRSLQHLKLYLEQLYAQIGSLEEYFESVEEKGEFQEQLVILMQAMQQSQETHLLAKGELQGISRLGSESGEVFLKGVGFNYDFPDLEGPARDLRTGEVMGYASEDTLPILKVHDVLVTTGMDGIFPSGLYVAEVTKIHPLQEGDFYYNLEARPTLGNIHELSFVTILPPVESFEHE